MDCVARFEVRPPSLRMRPAVSLRGKTGHGMRKADVMSRSGRWRIVGATTNETVYRMGPGGSLAQIAFSLHRRFADPDPADAPDVQPMVRRARRSNLGLVAKKTRDGIRTERERSDRPGLD